MSKFWKEKITKDVALLFLDELKSYSNEIINAGCNVVKSIKNNNPIINKEFNPYGAVIHSTHTATIYDALYLIGRQTYNTHFVISQKIRPALKFLDTKKYTLLSELPATIINVFDYDKFCNHSDYISNITYGIDLRNIGRVRPYHSIFDNKPPPIFYTEEQDEQFFYNNKNGNPSFYYFDDMWRKQFTGNVKKWGNFYFENPNRGQLETLGILLRVLNAITPLKSELIVPSNCVIKQRPSLPHLQMHKIRAFASGLNISLRASDTLIKSYADEWNIKQRSDYFYSYLAKQHIWRSTNDLGFLNELLNITDNDFKFDENIIPVMNELGYDTNNAIIARNMYAIACNELYDINSSYKNSSKLISIYKGEYIR